MTSYGSVSIRALRLTVAAALVAFGIWALLPERPAYEGAPELLAPVTAEPRPEEDLAIPDAEEDRGPARERDPSRLGGVEGRVVTHDRRAVSKATLEALEGYPFGLPGSRAMASLERRVSVGTDGRFTLEKIPATSQLVLRVDGDSFPLFEAGPFAVSANQTTDIGDLVAPSGISLRGTVFDPQGHPVVGARILLRYGISAGSAVEEMREPGRAVFSDDQGLFRISHAQRSPFLLDVAAKGFANALVRGGVNTAPEVHELNVPVALERATPLKGLVLGTPGLKRLAGARVLAVPMDPGRGRSETFAGDGGHFTITGLARGNYMVTAYHKGYSMTSKRTWTHRFDEELVLRMRAQGSISGTIVGKDGEKITHFDLRVSKAYQRGVAPDPIGKYRRTVDRDGNFTVEDLDPGFYGFEVWAKGYAITVSEPLKLERGKHLQGLMIRLKEEASFKGIIVSDTGMPIPNAKVSLRPNKEMKIAALPMVHPHEARMQKTRTNLEGQFTLLGITEGVYRIEVDHPDYPVTNYDDQWATAARQIDLGTLQIPTAATVRGFAMDGYGQPEAGVLISLARQGGATRQTTSSSTGAILFERVSPGTYSLTCTPRGLGFTDAIVRALDSVRRPPDLFMVRAGETLMRTVTCRQ